MQQKKLFESVGSANWNTQIPFKIIFSLEDWHETKAKCQVGLYTEWIPIICISNCWMLSCDLHPLDVIQTRTIPISALTTNILLRPSKDFYVNLSKLILNIPIYDALNILLTCCLLLYIEVII